MIGQGLARGTWHANECNLEDELVAFDRGLGLGRRLSSSSSVEADCWRMKTPLGCGIKRSRYTRVVDHPSSQFIHQPHRAFLYTPVVHRSNIHHAYPFQHGIGHLGRVLGRPGHSCGHSPEAGDQEWLHLGQSFMRENSDRTLLTFLQCVGPTW